jgi:8-oxo-dGTP pyrophosphatase MutT (NUDIX family)
VQRQIQRFEVSLKAFIVSGPRTLLLQEADTGYWELPGGRIDAGEEREAHELILRREIAEELGPEIEIAIGPEAVTWVRRRPSDGVFTFLVGRVCPLIGGRLRLSGEHAGHLWARPDDWQGLEFPPESGYVRALAALSGIAALASR